VKTFRYKHLTTIVLGCLTLSACNMTQLIETSGLSAPTSTSSTKHVVDATVTKAEETPVPEVKLAGDDPKALVASLLRQNCKGSQCKAPKREIPVQILFKTGSIELEESAKQKLKGIGEELKENSTALFKTRKLQINGHTDSVGNPEKNRRLSQERAKVVLNFLVDNFGLSADHIEFKGHGSSDLYIKNEATSEDRAKNRRVGFKMIYEGEN